MTERTLSTEILIAIAIAVVAHGLLLFNFWYEVAGHEHDHEHVDVLPIAINLAQQEQLQTTASEPPVQAQTHPPVQPRPQPVKPRPKPTPAPKPKPQPSESRPTVTENTVEKTPDNQNPAPVTQPAQQASSSLQAVELKYLEELRKAIMLHRQYPSRARRRHQEGTATITFVLRKNGVIEKSRIEGSSGFKTLDQAALQAVQELGQYEPIPSELHRDQWPLSVSLQFTLR